MSASVPGYTLIIFNSLGPVVKCCHLRRVELYRSFTDAIGKVDRKHAAQIPHVLDSHASEEKRAEIFYHSLDVDGGSRDRLVVRGYSPSASSARTPLTG